MDMRVQMKRWMNLGVYAWMNRRPGMDKGSYLDLCIDGWMNRHPGMNPCIAGRAAARAGNSLANSDSECLR